MFYALEDYSIDSRGDIGSWIREASMKSFELILFSFENSKKSLDFFSLEKYQTSSTSQNTFWTLLMGKLIRQSIEKIDRLRETAGKIVLNLLWNLKSAQFPHSESLKRILPKEKEISWGNPSELFPIIIHVLEIEEYRLEFMLGLMASVGCLTETLVLLF